MSKLTKRHHNFNIYVSIFTEMLLLDEIYNKRILFTALNWGAGHLSRSLPIINQLQQQGNAIVIFCTSNQEVIYRQYLNEITYVRHEPYAFNFDHKGFNTWKFIRSIPDLAKSIKKERKAVSEYVLHHAFDIILSDQSFGFRHKRVPSILITHQLTLAVPWYLYLGQIMNQWQIKKFNQVWVLDNERHEYAGNLSKSSLKHVVYIGIKSRFQLYKHMEQQDKSHNILVLNGPSAFTEFLLSSMNKEFNHINVVIGKHESIAKTTLQVVNWKEADSHLLSAKTIYSYCGYSTLMDVAVLGCQWHCIPTPGQFEQLYLHKKTLTNQGFTKKL